MSSNKIANKHASTIDNSHVGHRLTFYYKGSNPVFVKRTGILNYQNANVFNLQLADGSFKSFSRHMIDGPNIDGCVLVEFIESFA